MNMDDLGLEKGFFIDQQQGAWRWLTHSLTHSLGKKRVGADLIHVMLHVRST